MQVALTASITRDTMADLLECAEFLDVDVDQLAGMLPLIAADWLRRLQRSESVQAEPAQNAADGGRRYPDFGADLLARVAAQNPDGGTRSCWGLAWQ